MFVWMMSSEWLNLLWLNMHGMVMHHHDWECHAKRLLCYLQGHGSIIKVWPWLLCISWTADPFVSSFSFVKALYCKSECLVKRLWTAVFKFKDTWFKIPLNLFEYYIFCICEYYIFCTTDLLCNQIRCVDVQLLITRSSANKVGIL